MSGCNEIQAHNYVLVTLELGAVWLGRKIFEENLSLP